MHKRPEDCCGRAASEKKIDLERRSSVAFFVGHEAAPRLLSTASSKSSTSAVSARWISGARINVSPMEQIRFYCCRKVVQIEFSRFHSDEVASKVIFMAAVDGTRENYCYHHKDWIYDRKLIANANWLDFVLRNESCTEPSVFECNGEKEFYNSNIARRLGSTHFSPENLRPREVHVSLSRWLPHTALIFMF